MAIQGARADNGHVTPHLMVRGGRKAIEFYSRAFGATVLYDRRCRTAMACMRTCRLPGP